MDNKIISTFSDIINSDLLKSIYPMVDRINIVSLKKNPHSQEYDMHVNIYLNDPKIDKHNMYKMGFDPHYLVNKHLTNLSKLLGIELKKVHFKLYSSDGKLFLNWS